VFCEDEKRVLVSDGVLARMYVSFALQASFIFCYFGWRPLFFVILVGVLYFGSVRSVRALVACAGVILVRDTEELCSAYEKKMYRCDAMREEGAPL
jgi:hypothetical protein